MAFFLSVEGDRSGEVEVGPFRCLVYEGFGGERGRKDHLNFSNEV